MNDRNFFNVWQLLYRKTCPSMTHTQWLVGDVEWRKDRHSFFGSAYAVSNEVHTLRRPSRHGGWLLMVVIENWWDGQREAIKSTTWARVLEGDAKTVVAWMRGHERQAELALPDSPHPDRSAARPS